MPTLEQWFELYSDSPDILLNIDIKFPADEYLDEFDIDLYTKKIVELIDKYDAGKKVVCETFSDKIVNSLLQNSSDDRDFLIV